MIRILIVLFLGYKISPFLKLPTSYLVVLTISFTIFSALLLSLSHKVAFRSVKWIGFSTHLTIFLMSVLLQKQRFVDGQQIRHDNQRFLHHSYFFSGLVKKSDIHSKQKWVTSEIHITHYYKDSVWESLELDISAIVENDSIPLGAGSEVIFRAQIDQILSPLNPGEIDFKEYYSAKGIEHRAFLSKDNYSRIGKVGYLDLEVRSIQFRNHLSSLLDSTQLESSSVDFLNALVLGDRSRIDKELKELFKSSGLVHIMAVSGLHVGTLFFLVQFIFNYAGSRFRSLRFISGLIILWSYAFITGLSPSVMRSVIMFTLIMVAEAFRLRTNTFNLVAGSAVLLLIIDPSLTSNIGFLLSYSAVAGIILIHKRLHDQFSTGWKIPDMILSMACVSISAQTLTCPFIIHYFGEFPTYFLLANIVALPIVTLVFYSAIVLLTIVKFQSIALVVSYFIDRLLEVLFWIVNEVSQLPYSVISGLYIDQEQLLLIYTIVIALILSLISLRWCVFSLLITLNIYLIDIVIKNDRPLNNEIWIYAFREMSSVDLINDDTSIFIHNGVETYGNDFYKYNIKEHHRSMYIDNNKVVNSWEDKSIDMDYGWYRGNGKIGFIEWHGKRIQIIWQKSQVEPITDLKLDYLVISGNSIHPEEIKREILNNIGKVVLDNTNFVQTIRSWNNTKEVKKDRLIILKETGAMRVR